MELEQQLDFEDEQMEARTCDSGLELEEEDFFRDDNDNDDDEENETRKGTTTTSSGLPTPPDGGWGWMVVFASFMIHVIADGITYSFGVFVVELMSVFSAGRGTVSLIHSILAGVTLCVGPLASSFTNRYGCRVATVVGAVLASLGLALSTMATSVSTLYLSIGILTGVGFGFIYLPAIVSVSMYFEKRRAFATGIAVCGSGLGTFILAPITQSLVDKYEWTGALLASASLALICAFFGLLFRPLASSASLDEKSEESKEQKKEDDDDDHRRGENGDDFQQQGIVLPSEIRRQSVLRPLAQQLTADNVVILPPSDDEEHDDHHVNVGQHVSRMALSHPVISSTQKHNTSTLLFGSHSRIYDKKKASNNGTNGSKGAKGDHDYLKHLQAGAGVMFRKDILYSGSLYNIPEYKSNPRRYARAAKRAQEMAELEAVEEETSPICFNLFEMSAESTRALRQMLDFSLLKDGLFMMFVVSNFLTSVGFPVPYVYTVDRAVLLGIEKDRASFLLSVIGIANTLGRICLGYLSDQTWLNRLYLYNGCLIVCGITLGVSNWCTSYISQAIYCALFGITSGAYIGLTSVVLVDLLGLDRLTNAFGILLLFQGIASVIGPPIIGWLYDRLGNYNSGFYVSGLAILVSGAMLFALPAMKRRQQAQEKMVDRA